METLMAYSSTRTGSAEADRGAQVDVTLGQAWARTVAISPHTPLPDVSAVDPRIHHALRIVEDGLLCSGAGMVRSVPSAGAIYPYDVMVLLRGRGARDASAHHLDLARRMCVQLDIDAGRIDTLLAPQDEDFEACILLVVRPWLSIRKYGTRGFLYTQIDAGHAVTNMLGTALERGQARLRLSLPREEISKALHEQLPWREAHSVIDLHAAPETLDAPAGWRFARRNDRTVRDSTLRLEEISWNYIPAILRLDGGRTESEPVEQPLVRIDGADQADWIERDAWSELSRRRRSCKRFGPGTPEPDALLGAIGALGTPLPVDLDPEGAEQFGASVVVGPGTLGTASPASWTGASHLAETDWVHQPQAVADACMGQQHLAGASMFVVFHDSRRRVLERTDPRNLREAMFRAAGAAQLIYLGAARSGVAITAVGGFDTARWRGAANLSDDREIFYILALGSDGPGHTKLDRSEIALAQGER